MSGSILDSAASTQSNDAVGSIEQPRIPGAEGARYRAAQGEGLHPAEEGSFLKSELVR